MRRLALALALIAGAASAGPLPFIAAHRGNAGTGAPENTPAAIRDAIAAGADAIEVDLRQTADGAIVILHDATVDRTTDGHGAVAKMALARVRALNAGRGERVPTLAEAFALLRGSRASLLLDLKRGGAITPAAILAMAREQGVEDRLIVGVRTVGDARAFRAASPDLRILALMPGEGQARAFHAAGADAVRLWQNWIDAPRSGCRGGRSPRCVVSRLQAEGVKVWALPSVPADAEAARRNFARLIALGLDGMLTDRADLALEMRGARTAR